MTPTEAKQAQIWLFKLNDGALSGAGVDLQTWVEEQVKSVNLDPINVKYIVADNSSVNNVLFREMEAQFIPCTAHTLNLLVEGAWAKLADGWPSKVSTMIANFNKSSSMMSALEKRQTAALIPQLKLLDWMRNFDSAQANSLWLWSPLLASLSL